MTAPATPLTLVPDWAYQALHSWLPPSVIEMRYPSLTVVWTPAPLPNASDVVPLEQIEPLPLAVEVQRHLGDVPATDEADLTLPLKRHAVSREQPPATPSAPEVPIAAPVVTPAPVAATAAPTLGAIVDVAAASAAVFTAAPVLLLKIPPARDEAVPAVADAIAALHKGNKEPCFNSDEIARLRDEANKNMDEWLYIAHLLHPLPAARAEERRTWVRVVEHQVRAMLAPSTERKDVRRAQRIVKSAVLCVCTENSCVAPVEVGYHKCARHSGANTERQQVKRKKPP